MDEFNTMGVCFLQEEAESCAQKAMLLDGKFGYNSTDEMPLNIEDSDAAPSLKGEGFKATSPSRDANKGQFVSSNSTVVTTSSAGSSGGCSLRGSESTVTASVTANTGPPLEEVRTLSTTFTDNLVKDNSSRQGRSLQRWLVHAPTEQLVRQVAGTIPITRDGRIILASASRKKEWILPKGGWDADETKEECATRETYEEAGLLGQLGGCLEPIDYETSKAKKRRLSMMGVNGKDGGKVKKIKTDKLTTSISACSDSASPSIENAGSSEKPHGHSDGSSVNKKVGDLPPTSAVTKPHGPRNHSYVRLFLCPLYVTSVKSDWPEKGRLRKLVDIDEAIKIMELENRHYFKKGLEMVKERGLHLLKP